MIDFKSSICFSCFFLFSASIWILSSLHFSNSKLFSISFMSFAILLAFCSLLYHCCWILIDYKYFQKLLSRALSFYPYSKLFSLMIILISSFNIDIIFGILSLFSSEDLFSDDFLLFDIVSSLSGAYFLSFFIAIFTRYASVCFLGA